MIFSFRYASSSTERLIDIFKVTHNLLHRPKLGYRSGKPRKGYANFRIQKKKKPSVVAGRRIYDKKKAHISFGIITKKKSLHPQEAPQIQKG